MEEQKYYTPAPEDIRIGYQLEYKDANSPFSTTIIEPDDVEDILYWLWRIKHKAEQQRVPYLTAEQIEAEGWKYLRKNGYNNNVYELIKNGLYYTLHFNQNQKFNVTVHTHADKSFSGTCRCINDLRLICKLLGI